MKNLVLLGAVAIGILAVSCEKKSDDKKEGDSFSSYTVEENKANIEDEGIAMLEEIQLIENEPAIEANISMVSLMSESSPFKINDANNDRVKASIAFAPVYASTQIANKGVNEVLKSTLMVPGEEPVGIQDLYDELVGIYEWNASANEWAYSETGDEIVIKFPAEEGGTTNNATYTVSYVGYTGANPLQDMEDGYEGDIPQNVAAVLEVDGTEVSKLTADATYDSDGIPASIDVSFSLGEFVWSAGLTNTVNTEFAAEAAFTHSNNVILKLQLGVAGNWSEDNVENNINTVYYAEWWDEETGYHWEEISESELGNYDYTHTEQHIDIHKIIKEGNAYFQAMNLKIVGEVDFETLGTKILEIEDAYSSETEEETMMTEQAAAMNEYASLSLRYVDSDEIIALVEAYPVSEEYSWEEWWYDGEWHDEPRTVTEVDWDMEMRFVFADDSRVDMETYMDEGFDDLIDELEDWADELENTYGK